MSKLIEKCLYCNNDRTNPVDTYFCSQECSDKYDLAEELATIEEDEVICPYCKLKQNDIADGDMYYEANDDLIECQFCNKEFILTADTYTRFTATATEDEINMRYELEKSEEDE